MKSDTLQGFHDICRSYNTFGSASRLTKELVETGSSVVEKV